MGETSGRQYLCWCGAWALTLVLLAVPVGHVAAQAAVHVDVPAACGSEQQLVDRLQQAGARTLDRDATIELVISQLPTQDYELQLSWRNEQRTLRDSQCAALFDSAVVILAAAMARASDATAAAAPHEGAAPPPAAAPPTQESPREIAGATTPNPSLLVGIGALASVGTLPRLSPGLELALLASSKRFGAGLDIQALLPSTRDAARGHAVEVFGLGARLLATLALLQVLHLRAGPSVMLLMAHGAGVAVQSNRGTGVRPGFSLELAARTHLVGRFSSELALSGDVALLRPRFEIAGIDTAFRTPLTAAWLRLRIFHEFR